jgi:hypothetical protein
MTLSAPLYLVAAMAVFTATVEASIEIDNHDALLASCQVLKTSLTDERTKSCQYYIYGFLDAGKVTDAVATEQLSEDNNERSSFIERAYRNRVGSIDERTKETQAKPFCIPQQQSHEQIVEYLAENLPSSIETAETLKTSVYTALSTEYPCG